MQDVTVASKRHSYATVVLVPLHAPTVTANQNRFAGKIISQRVDHAPPLHAKMILTTCAACAAPRAHDAPGCGVCATRYCSEACRLDGQRGGHNEVCLAIHDGGNAEQYHADKKYEEAAAVAVEACAAAVPTREARSFLQEP